MWNSIANLKENLDKIALDVHGSDEDEGAEELEIRGGGDEDSSASVRRNSHKFAHTKPASRPPAAPEVDSPYNSEIEQYKAEIKKLKDSESEIKALSVNYAALLKEKEDQIMRLNVENGSLKQNLNTTNDVLKASRSDSFKTSTNGTIVLKGNGKLSPNQQNKYATQFKNRSSGNHIQNGLYNGVKNSVHPNENRLEPKDSNFPGKEKELAELLEENNRSLVAAQATYESQIKQLRMELEREHNNFKSLQLKLQDEQKLNGSFQAELESIRREKEKAFVEKDEIKNELNKKMSEIRRLQMELQRKQDEDADDVQSLKKVNVALENENENLKKVHSLGNFPGKEELELNLQKLESNLKEANQGKDKALQQLARLKQHLLDKESEDSEKMDEDSKIIEELRAKNEYQRAQILNLENSLKQAIACQEEFKMANNSELQKSKDIIDDLHKNLASCWNTIDSKNVELQNLQTALGQYYAEIEAKEHLERELGLATEESAKQVELLKVVNQQLDLSKKQKDEILEKLSQTERILAEGRARSNKLEEDNAKLRRALEQSMTRINTMSMDSNYFVDRRIVIKLLVTYFQRNHSKEVLQLMVRMLGFSDDDKQRIGIAQQGAGKGVVRGVLGLPGRLVGGILGGTSTEVKAITGSDNQSIADLWVDFLLKETEERERREPRVTNGELKEDPRERNLIATVAPLVHNEKTVPGATISNSSLDQNSYFLPPTRRNSLQSVHSDSEFSTVPLTSSESSSQISGLLQKY